MNRIKLKHVADYSKNIQLCSTAVYWSFIVIIYSVQSITSKKYVLQLRQVFSVRYVHRLGKWSSTEQACDTEQLDGSTK